MLTLRVALFGRAEEPLEALGRVLVCTVKAFAVYRSEQALRLW